MVEIGGPAAAALHCCVLLGWIQIASNSAKSGGANVLGTKHRTTDRGVTPPAPGDRKVGF
jgi:hypothetical protein